MVNCSTYSMCGSRCCLPETFSGLNYSQDDTAVCVGFLIALNCYVLLFCLTGCSQIRINTEVHYCAGNRYIELYSTVDITNVLLFICLQFCCCSTLSGPLYIMSLVLWLPEYVYKFRSTLKMIIKAILQAYQRQKKNEISTVEYFTLPNKLHIKNKKNKNKCAVVIALCLHRVLNSMLFPNHLVKTHIFV